MSDEEEIKVFKQINITSIATTAPNLVLWFWVFHRIMRQTDRAKYRWLIAVSVLMIVSMIASIASFQIDYTFNVRRIDGSLDRYKLATNLLLTCYFISNTTFNLAHWIFAFSYFVLA